MYGKTGILTIPFQLNWEARKTKVGVAVKSSELGVSVMYPFNIASCSKARNVSLQINFDKNVVNCLVDGKKKGLVFNGPKDLRKTSFGLFIETKNQGSKVEILNKLITYVPSKQSDQVLSRSERSNSDKFDENMIGITPNSTRDQTRENSDRE